MRRKQDGEVEKTLERFEKIANGMPCFSEKGWRGFCFTAANEAVIRTSDIMYLEEERVYSVRTDLLTRPLTKSDFQKVFRIAEINESSYDAQLRFDEDGTVFAVFYVEDYETDLFGHYFADFVKFVSDSEDILNQITNAA